MELDTEDIESPRKKRQRKPLTIADAEIQIPRNVLQENIKDTSAITKQMVCILNSFLFL